MNDNQCSCGVFLGLRFDHEAECKAYYLPPTEHRKLLSPELSSSPILSAQAATAASLAFLQKEAKLPEALPSGITPGDERASGNPMGWGGEITNSAWYLADRYKRVLATFANAFCAMHTKKQRTIETYVPVPIQFLDYFDEYQFETKYVDTCPQPKLEVFSASKPYPLTPGWEIAIPWSSGLKGLMAVYYARFALNYSADDIVLVHIKYTDKQGIKDTKRSFQFHEEMLGRVANTIAYVTPHALPKRMLKEVGKTTERWEYGFMRNLVKHDLTKVAASMFANHVMMTAEDSGLVDHGMNVDQDLTYILSQMRKKSTIVTELRDTELLRWFDKTVDDAKRLKKLLKASSRK